VAIKIFSILEEYDKETKGNLALDFIQDVFRNKSYKLSEYIRMILDEWIPIWKDERQDDLEIINTLEKELKMIV
jgi:hypothetical protein